MNRSSKPSPRFLAKAILAALAVVAMASVQAQTTYVWQRTSATNSWNTAGNWSPATVAGGTGNIADFTGFDFTTTMGVTLDGSRTIGHLRFGDTGTFKNNWNLLAGSGGTLTLGVSSGSPTITVSVTNVAIFPSLNSPAGFSQSGLSIGVLDLRAANTLSGTVAMSNGVLQVRNSGGLGTNSSVVVNWDGGVAGGTGTRVQLENVNIPAGVGISLTSSNQAATSRRSSLYANSGTNFWNGPIAISGNDLTQIYANGSGVRLTVNGNITGTSGLVFLRGGAGTGTIAGNVNIGGTGVSKTDSSTWIVNSVNNVWGTTAVADGTLRLGAHNAIPTTTFLTLGQSSTTTGTFDLGGFDQEVAGLAVATPSGSSAHSIGNSSTTSDSTLTFNGTAPSTFRCLIRDVLGAGTRRVALKVSGGQLTLATNNTFTGRTWISGGTLALSSFGGLASTNIVVDGTNGFDVSANAFVVASNQVLSGTGSISGLVTVGTVGYVSPGGAGVANTLTFNNGLVCNNRSFLSFDLANVATEGGGTNDLIVVNGDLTINGTVRCVLNTLNGSFASPGTYVLVRYTGNLLGAGSFAASGPRYTYTFDTSTPGEIRLTISGTATPASLAWVGDCVSDVWETVGTPGLWINESTFLDDVFYQGDNVTLDDLTLCFPPYVNLSGVLRPGSVRLNNTVTYTLSGGGSLDGAMNLTKDASGTLVISNANTHTGTNFLNDGVTVAGHPSALGSTTGPTIIAGTATLDVNGQNLGAEPVVARGAGYGSSGAIINSGPEQQSALRDVTLTADTTFAGANRWDMRSAVSGDRVLQANGFNVTKTGPNTVYIVNNQTNLVDSGLGNMDVAQGTFGAAYNITLGNPAATLTLQAGAGFQVSSTGTNRLEKVMVMGNDSRFETRSGANAFAGPVTLNGNALFDLSSGTSLRMDGNIGGASGYLIKTTNTGTLQLAGTNSFPNPVNVYGGNLAANSDAALGSGAVINVNSNPAAAAAGTGTSLQLNNVAIPSGVQLYLNTSVPNLRASLVANTGTNVWNGPVTCTGAAQAGLNAAALLTLNGNVLASEPDYFAGTIFFRGVSSGVINGVVNLGTNYFFKTDVGVWTVNSVGHAWGFMIVADGTVRLGGDNVLPTAAPLRIGQPSGTTGHFDLAGFNQTIPSLDVDPATTSFAHDVGNSSTNADSRLTIAGPGNSLFGGVIRDVLGAGTRKVGLTVSGGRFTLTNDNLYSDTTIIGSGATLQLGNATARGSIGAGEIINDGVLVLNRSTAATLTNLISGGGGVTNSGAGTIVLAGTNTYSGLTAASSGKLVLTTAKLGVGDLVVNDGATLGVRVLSQGAKVTAEIATFGFGTGSALEVDMGMLTNLTGPALEVSGNLAVNGPLTVNVTAANSFLTSGRFPLVRYDTLSLAGSLVMGTLPPRVTATVEDNPGNKTIDLVISSADSIRWSGSASTSWDINSSINWLTLIGAAATTYQQPGAAGETVLFDDNLSANPGVNLTTTLSPVLLTVSNQSASYSFAGSGKVSGATTVVKDGNGSLTVATANDYTGLTQIKAGTVVLSNNTALGTTAGGTIISNGATLDSNTRSPGLEPVVVSGAGVGGLGAIINSSSTNQDTTSDFRDISLAGHTTFGGGGRWDIRAAAATDLGLRGNGYNLTKVGAGTVAIVAGSGRHWDTGLGDVDVQAGALAIEQDSTLGLPAATLTVRSNAALQIYNTGPTNPADKIFVLEDRGTFRSTGPAADPRATNVCVGPISASGVPILDVGNLSTLYLFSEVTGSGGLDRAGTGNLFMHGSNYLAGTLTLQNGNTYLDSTNSPAVVASNVVISASGGSARLILNRHEQLDDATVVTLASTAANQSRFIPNGRTETIAGLAGDQGAQPRIVEAAADDVENTPSTLVLKPLAGATNDFNGYVRDAAGTPRPTNSQLTIIKAGPGVQVFSGPAAQVSYSGDTTISNGVLAVTGIDSVLNNSRVQLDGGTVAFLGGGTRTNAIVGTGGVVVDGASTLTLSGTHAYQGSTLVSSGTLVVSGVIGTGSGTVTIDGGTLGGTGAINHAVTVLAGGTLAAGASIGTLTVNNTLTLAGNTAVEINKTGATLTADKVTGISTLAYGGTLTVTASGDALAVGDTFDLFDATTFTGAFTALDLPALPGDWSWDTSSLTTDGTIKVSAQAPRLSIRYDSSSITLEWPPAAGYSLQAQTNAVGEGLRTNALDWINWPGAPNPLIVSPVPTNANVFFRLVKP
jgi:autotransporter-associated beta strand protein